MPEQCHVFCSSDNAAELLSILKDSPQVNACSLDGDDANWNSVVCDVGGSLLFVTRLAENKGEDFTEILANTGELVESTDTSHDGIQTQLKEFVISCPIVLGVIAEPEFDEDSEELLFNLVKVGKGVIFTGNLFLNIEGGLVFDIEGNSEESIFPS